MKLLEKQEHAIFYLKDNTTTEVLYGGAAGGGKSALGVLWIIECCQKYDGSRWLVGRSKAKTLKETTLNTFFDLTKQLGLSKQYNYNQQSGTIAWINGSEIILKDLFLYPSDPDFDELGSLEITGAFIDECSQIVRKAWQIVKSRIRYKLNEFGLIPKMLGTCNPSQSWVYSEFYLKDKSNILSKSKKFIKALPTDNQHLPPSYLESLLELDEPSKQRLYYGNWDYNDDPNALCDYDAICDIFTNDHVPEGENRISADLAMQGRDKFISGLWSGLRCTVSIDKSLSSGKDIERDLTELKNNSGVGNSKIVADGDGLGAYLESYIKNIKTFHGNSTAFEENKSKDKRYRFSNLKTQCAFKLAELINARLLKVICTKEQEELIKKEISICLKSKSVDDEKKSLISKDTMKKLLGNSPDYLDMLIMGMYFEVSPVKKRGSQKLISSKSWR